MDDFFQNLPKIQTTEESVVRSGQNTVSLETFGQEKTALIATESDGSNATVETVHENDTLKKIIIRCDCGREIILECRY